MYKSFLTVVLCTLPFWASSQQSQLPKVRHQHSVFTSRWEIGDKDATEQQVYNHLKQHNPEAFKQFKKSRSLNEQALMWGIFGLVSVGVSVVGLVKDNDQAVVGGLVGAGVCEVLSYSFSFGAKRRQQQGVDIYNRAAGY